MTVVTALISRLALQLRGIMGIMALDKLDAVLCARIAELSRRYRLPEPRRERILALLHRPRTPAPRDPADSATNSVFSTCTQPTKV